MIFLKKLFLTAFICALGGFASAQIKAIDSKGTFKNIDTSKWTLSGINIYHKNAGNVGIGTNNPQTKLHVTGLLRLGGLGTSTTNTDLLTADANGDVTKRTFTSLLNGNAITSLNGLTTSSQTFALGTTGTDVGISSVGSTHTFNFPSASAANRGLLTSANWTTFNNKVGSVLATAPVTANTTGTTVTIGLNRNSIIAGSSSAAATSPLVLDAGATNAVVGGSNATITINNTAALWNASQLQGRNIDNAAPSNGQSLVWNGTAWSPTNIPFTVSNNIIAPNSITTTVNGVTGGAVNLVAAVGNVSSANNLTTTVNGVSGSAVQIINTNAISKPTTNTLRTSVNGVASASDATIISSNTLVGTGSKLTSTVNGVSADLIPAVGVIDQGLGFDASGNLVKASASSSSGWALTGNAGTTAGTNFLGTTDGQDLVFKANSVEAGRLSVYDLSASYGLSAISAYKSANIGYGAGAAGKTESVALGYLAKGDFQGVSIGVNSQNTNTEAVAIGAVSKASYQSVALGHSAEAIQNSTVAIGHNAKAIANQNATAVGKSSVASGQNSTALGQGSTASGTNATAIGFNVTANQNNTVILGNNANVGIGTNNPGNKLEVNTGTSGSSGLRLANLTGAAILSTNTNGDVINANPPAGTIAAAKLLGFNAAGNLVVGSDPTPSVSSFSGGTTGLTPGVASTGAIVLAGTLKPENGGTGNATIPAVGVMLVGNGTTYDQLTPGAAGTILTSNGTGSAPSWVASSFPEILVVANRVTSAYTVNTTYSTLVYNAASTNVGSAYSTSSGEFTAPAAGMYQFIFHNTYSYTQYTNNTVFNRILLSPGSTNVVDLEVANGSWPESGTTATITVSGNTIVNLTAGQKVAIQQREDRGVNNPTALLGDGQHRLKIIRLK